MNRICSMLFCLLICHTVGAQREMTSLYTQQQLEDLSEKGITATEDDSFLQKLQFFSRNPLNINKAAKEDLEELGLLNEIQINQLLTYRRLLGNLVSVYELQAIPGWDPALIQSVLPYITLTDAATRWNALKKAWQQGEHSLLLRYSTLLEKPAGYRADTTGDSRYLGSPAKLYMRYQYRDGNVFELTAHNGGWTYNVLYEFSDGLSGSGPKAPLIMDASGNLYGTEWAAPGGGSVFKLTPYDGVWTETYLYQFTDHGDGGFPVSNILFDSSGNLYGTASSYGVNNWGVLWEITP